MEKLVRGRSSHWISVWQALFVTFLWSTSWVLIKIGLLSIPALTFAGLRYTLAFLSLLPLIARPHYITVLRRLSGKEWAHLALLGLILYATTQGAQFLGLSLLPAVTVSLLLGFSPLIVLTLGKAMKTEPFTARQTMGVWLSLVGVIVYFYPTAFPAGEVLGLFIVCLGVFANAGGAILGRQINSAGHLPPLLVTTISMGVGGLLLFTSGIFLQGFPPLTGKDWAIVWWLALVNTAFAFTLWNHTLRTLSAIESSIINNTMLIQIALLAWIFLDESLSLKEITGLILVSLGTLIVQLRR